MSTMAPLQGALTPSDFHDLVHLIANRHQSGRLDIVAAKGVGQIFFRDGQPVYAALKSPKGNLSGDEAFIYMTDLPGGSFQFEAGSPHTPPPNIRWPLTCLLLEGFCH